MAISEITIKPVPNNLLLPQDKQTTPITQESDPNSSIDTAEIVSSSDILQAALGPSTILKYKTYQVK